VFDRGHNSVELPSPPEPLPPHALVAIIGGGVMGVSTAFHLARAGAGSVLVIEQNLLGSGSSAKPLGGVRATFSDPANIALAQLSLEAFETELKPSSESTSAFGRLDTCSSAGPRPTCRRSSGRVTSAWLETPWQERFRCRGLIARCRGRLTFMIRSWSLFGPTARHGASPRAACPSTSRNQQEVSLPRYPM
jgi:hypothetical protein